MKFVDDYKKELKWYNRNYFFLGTIIAVGLMFLIYYVLGATIENLVDSNVYLTYLFAPISFQNVQSLVISAVCVLLASLFLEKYWGSIKYFIVFLISLPITSMMVSIIFTTYSFQNLEYVSEGLQLSYMVYTLFGFVIVGMIFNLKKYLFDGKHSVLNWILLVLIIAIMCVLFPTEYNNDIMAYIKEIKFGAFSGLLKNVYHWSSLIVGAMLSLLCEIFRVTSSSGNGDYVESNDKHHKNKKSKDDTGLTFADIMEKDKETENTATTLNSNTVSQSTTTSTQSSTPSAFESYMASSTRSTSTGYNPNRDGDLNSIFGTTSNNNNNTSRVVVGETVKQYSNYNEYINEKMKNLNTKVNKDNK